MNMNAKKKTTCKIPGVETIGGQALGKSVGVSGAVIGAVVGGGLGWAIGQNGIHLDNAVIQASIGQLSPSSSR